jgi:hypothetical protein
MNFFYIPSQFIGSMSEVILLLVLKFHSRNVDITFSLKENTDLRSHGLHFEFHFLKSRIVVVWLITQAILLNHLYLEFYRITKNKKNI